MASILGVGTGLTVWARDLVARGSALRKARRQNDAARGVVGYGEVPSESLLVGSSRSIVLGAPDETRALALSGLARESAASGASTVVIAEGARALAGDLSSAGCPGVRLLDSSRPLYEPLARRSADGVAELSFDAKLAALTAQAAGETTFTADGQDYELDADGNIIQSGSEVAYIGRFVVSAADASVVISRDFRDRLEEAIDDNITEFTYTDADGNEAEYDIVYDASTGVWSVKQMTETYVFDRYASPNKEHWLGTDTNGMDMLTRLMYGGRVSLIIGFIVVAIEGSIGIVMGGISGYFGGWVDNLIMRIVDVFYCLPSMPIIIILGAAMDAMRIDSWTRMMYLMLILGFLGWPGIARLVRGQILSLREQEFMTAAEACGISAWHRIFRHLIPNVIPQLIVTCTMSLGSTILTEATLSFLGLGVKYPFASWGNIINDVNNAYVMTNYLFIWVPAGICLLITVLGFNFVGDGLRDAFDPKMKR